MKNCGPNLAKYLKKHAVRAPDDTADAEKDPENGTPHADENAHPKSRKHKK